jgi:hypothetical protein
MRARSTLVALVVAFIVALPSPARATHHLWRFTQAFSNADGSVQFLELQVKGANDEQAIGGFKITSSVNPTGITLTNLDNTILTDGRWMLLATSGFAGLSGGVTPDFVIPAHFLPTGAGTITYAGAVDTWTYATLPTDGAHSVMRDYAGPHDTAVAAAMPRNFAGAVGMGLSAPSAVPAIPRVGIVALVGALLLAASGLLRKRVAPLA